jgi:DMSO reductase iron-sulfur subunit
MSAFVPVESLTRLRHVRRPVADDPVDTRPVLDRLKGLTPGSAEHAEVAVPRLRPGEQFRFHFDMSRCIGCRSCEAACNEQNDNLAHVRWRRVGEVEGGSYPNVRRLHLSMSCNHCLEPSCLEGCPTDAYSKLPNGIVSHDAEACIGCQYCTWSCPYGVPQYDPERRVVTKCHLCAERLEAGQLPACVEACPTSAIEIEAVDADDWRGRIALADAPGVPPADLTLSTTRITLPDDLPEDFGRTAAQRLAPEAAHASLTVFLVLSQWSIGGFAAALLVEALGRGAPPLESAAAVLTLFAAAVGQLALATAVLHLGRPLQAFRALRAWRRSWLSREALAFTLHAPPALLAAFAAALRLCTTAAETATGGGDAAPSPLEPLFLPALAAALATGLAGVASSVGIYRLPARPAWDTWRTPAQFFGTCVFLGASAASLALALAADGADSRGLRTGFVLAAAAAGLLQALLPWLQVAAGVTSEEPALRGAATLLARHCGSILTLRTAALVAAVGLTAASLAAAPPLGAALAAAALVLGLGAELAGRHLFFVTVVPRNMPGTFFTTASRGH